jgi:hypothetical protein
MGRIGGGFFMRPAGNTMPAGVSRIFPPAYTSSGGYETYVQAGSYPAYGNLQVAGWHWYGYMPAGTVFSFESYSFYAVPDNMYVYVIFQPVRSYPGL